MSPELLLECARKAFGQYDWGWAVNAERPVRYEGNDEIYFSLDDPADQMALQNILEFVYSFTRGVGGKYTAKHKKSKVVLEAKTRKELLAQCVESSTTAGR